MRPHWLKKDRDRRVPHGAGWRRKRLFRKGLQHLAFGKAHSKNANIGPAREYFKSVGITLEQGAVAFLEEYEKAEGVYESAVRAAAERFARIKLISGDAWEVPWNGLAPICNFDSS